MKLIWKSGHTREVTFGSRLVGVSSAGKRPIAVELSGAEMKLMMQGLCDKNKTEEEKTIFIRYLGSLAITTSGQS